MKNAKFIQTSRELSRPYRVTDGAKFRLRDVDPGDTGSFAAAEKPRAREALELGVAVLAEMQDRLFAQNQWSVLLIFQAMDAAGKDSAIKHVMTGVNPQGCEVTSFKVPSTEELDHDFMWRCTKRLPERGKIGIFNRSYYEETLVVRVHPELIQDERVPGLQAGDKLWEQRFGDIRHFERYLAHNGTVVRKFFLHVSRDEQKRRFLARLADPAKNWKFSSADVRERGYWKEYMAAYEDAIRATATPDAPWYVVPADNKWFTRIVVSSAIIDALSSLDLEYPTVTGAKRKDFAAAKKALLAETKARR